MRSNVVVLTLLFLALALVSTQAQCPTFSGRLRTIEHDVSGKISVSKDCTIQISDFTYDGGAPQVYIWWGEDCSSRSIARGGRFSNEEVPERRVSSSRFQADVRSGIDFDKVGCLSVYCEAFNANLGDVKATFDIRAIGDERPQDSEASPPPRDPPVPASSPPPSPPPSPLPSRPAKDPPRPPPRPPSSPPPASLPPSDSPPPSLENCHVLKKDYLQVQWTVSQDRDTVLMAIEGRPGPGDAWMAFGYSPPDSFGAQMVGSRVVVAGYAGDDCFAYDYSLTNREQCDFLNGMGVCPTAYSGNNTGDADIPIPPLQIECTRNSSYMRVLFERPVDTWPLDGGDSALWAMGPVSPGSDASRPVVLYHSLSLPGSDAGRPEPVNTPTGENLVVALDEAQNSCSNIAALSDDGKNQDLVADVPVLYNTTAFVVTSGPYDVHPDPPGWGLSYILNNVSLPVINMVRGQTYTFSIQSGPTHPLYFTTSPFGAGELSDFENEVVYAGGMDSFGTDAAPYELTVTPDDTWPDQLYYQCTVHQKLGWQVKIYDTQEESEKAGMAVDLVSAGVEPTDSDVEGTFIPDGACEMALDGAVVAFQSCATVPGNNNGFSGFNYAWNISAGIDPSSTLLSMGINATLDDDAYLAIAIPKTPNTMIGSDALVLSRDIFGQVLLLPYYLAGQTQNAIAQQSNNLDLIQTSTSLDGGDVAVGTFTVQIPVPFADISLENFNFLWATGRINDQGTPTYHGLDKGGIDANLVFGTSSSNTNTQTINVTAKEAHMWLMAIGWGLLIPSGVVSVRAKKSALPHIWFNAHRAAMTLGYLCGVGGIIAGFSIRGTWETPYSVHRDLGVTITVLGFVQILSLVARPAPNAKVRPMWVSWHRVVGVSTVCLAIANVYYGMFYVAKVANWAWGVYTGLLAAIIALAVANEMWIVRHTTTLREQQRNEEEEAHDTIKGAVAEQP